MKIIKKRVRNIENYLANIRKGEEFYIAFTDLQNNETRVNRVGFSSQREVGERILPNVIGPISRFNANGKFIIRRDLPKEEFYIEREWEWRDWGDNSHYSIVYIRRERFPRDFIRQPAEELTIDNYLGNTIIVSRRLVRTSQNLEEIRHIVNLFLEYFGECDIIRENYEPIISNNVVRLNWKLLPQGEYPWERVQQATRQRLQRETQNRRAIIENNLEIISSHNPNFVAIGQGGFNDYIVFGFQDRSIYILESIRSGNATYIFNNNWEELSRLTKAEILNNNLQQDRILHTPSWEAQINRMLG